MEEQMKVNINGQWFDAGRTPIQVQLNEQDKKNISNMSEDKFNYVCFPDFMSWDEAKKELKL